MNAPIADEADIDFDRASTHASSAAIDSPGRALQDARRARKLEIIRIATELRLSPETIDALERDDYEHLPSAVFVSGYIRTYARLLELDPEPLIARFRDLHPGAEPPPLVALRSSRLATTPGSGNASLLFAMLPLILIAILSYLWWSGSLWTGEGVDGPESAETPQDEMRPASSSGTALYEPDDADRDSATLPDARADRDGNMALAPPPPLEDMTDMTDVTDVTDETAALNRGATSLTDSLEPSTDQPDSTPTLPNQTETGAVTGVDLPPGVGTEPQQGTEGADTAIDGAVGAEVVVSFSGPCWVDIRDAEGEVLLFGEMADGDQHVLGGDPPYSLVLGNASATALTVGDKPFDVNAIAKGNVARFTLDPTELDPADDAPSTSGN